MSFRLRVNRFASKHDGSLGLVWLDDTFQCFSVEDEFREIKVPGETRIPPGIYELGLHRRSRFLPIYIAEYGPEHVGMIHVKGVPNFLWILIHWGNHAGNTDGCLCVGERVTGNPRIEAASVGPSRPAYRRVMFPLVKRLAAGESGTIEYIDDDRPHFDGMARV